MFKRRGKVFVISGPSGVGKGTLVKEVMKIKDLELSISCTSRAPRHNEVEGENYYYISKEEFKRRIDAGEFAEWAEVYGNYYGTPKEELERHLSQGRDVILEIEMLGAAQVKKLGEDAVLIFVLPPNLETLEKRLVTRGTETPEAVENRLSFTMEELGHISNYDYYLINNSIEEATKDLLAIIESQAFKIGQGLLDYLDEIERNFSF